MTIYCGVDFHVRRQTVCYCDTTDGQIHVKELRHEEDATRAFYAQLAGEVIVGLEASGYSTWFVELLEGLGRRVLIGDAAEIRRLAKRRQKNDRRDASLILDLLLRGEFPQVHRPPFESREVLRPLPHRHKLVQIRTRAKNGLQALAFSAGSPGRSRPLSREGRAQFLRLEMSEAMTRQREEWLSLVDDLNRRIKSLDAWLDERANADERVLRLQTHPGIGLLTSLALVHALEPVSRFGGAEGGGLRRLRPDGVLLGREAAVRRHQQGWLAAAALPAGGGGADHGQARRGAQVFLPATPGQARFAEGAGGCRAQAPDPRLYLFTRWRRLRGVPPPGRRSAACPACNIG